MLLHYKKLELLHGKKLRTAAAPPHNTVVRNRIESLENRVCRTFPSMIGSSHSGYKPIKIDATRRE